MRHPVNKTVKRKKCASSIAVPLTIGRLFSHARCAPITQVTATRLRQSTKTGNFPSGRGGQRQCKMYRTWAPWQPCFAASHGYQCSWLQYFCGSLVGSLLAELSGCTFQCQLHIAQWLLQTSRKKFFSYFRALSTPYAQSCTYTICILSALCKALHMK